MSMAKGITAQNALLPTRRDPYYQSFLPHKTTSNPPARKISPPVIIEADTVILGGVSEWPEMVSPEVPPPTQTIPGRILEEKSERPPLFWLLALKAYENQMPSLNPSRPSGLQINVLA